MRQSLPGRYRPPPTPPTPTPTPTPSPDQTSITTAGPAIIDNSGNSIAINAIPGQMTLNGSIISFTNSVIQIAWVSGVVWQKNTSNDWYSIVITNGVASPGTGPTQTSPLTPVGSRNYLQGVYVGGTGRDQTSTPNLMGYPFDLTIDRAQQDPNKTGGISALYSPAPYTGFPVICSMFHVNQSIPPGNPANEYYDFDAAANGSYNSMYASMAANVASVNATAGNGGMYAMRIDQEFSGNWFPWSPYPGTYQGIVRSNTITPAVWIAGYRNLALALRSAMPGLKIIWNPAIRVSDPYAYYPGDDVTDLLGPDVYFQPQYDANSTVSWSNTVGQMNTMAAFAVSHGKQICIPEWADCFGDGYVIGQMRTWLDNNNAVMHTYWDSGDALLVTARLPLLPTNQTAFANQFGHRAYTGTYWGTPKTVPSNTAVWP